MNQKSELNAVVLIVIILSNFILQKTKAFALRLPQKGLIQNILTSHVR